MSFICYLLAVYLCYSSVKISVSVIWYLCVYIIAWEMLLWPPSECVEWAGIAAALVAIKMLKIACYCKQNIVLQIAQNGGAGGGLGVTGFSHAGEPEFPPSCGSGPVAVGPQPKTPWGTKGS